MAHPPRTDAAPAERHVAADLILRAFRARFGRDPSSDTELARYRSYLLAHVIAAESIARNRYFHERTSIGHPEEP